MEKSKEAELFEEVEVDDSTLKEIPEDKRKPTIGDPKWTDYILSLLTEKEYVTIKDKKIPRMDGLRRVCNLVLGRVYSSESYVVGSPDQNNNFTATVQHTIKIKQSDGYDDLVITGVADASREYLQHPFNQYVVANASTKAMARAYRSALELQVLVADELNSVNDLNSDDEDGQPIESAQKAAIRSLCKRLSIDVDLFINSGAFSYKSLDQIPRGTARQMVGILNGYQSNPDKKIPEDIKL